LGNVEVLSGVVRDFSRPPLKGKIMFGKMKQMLLAMVALAAGLIANVAHAQAAPNPIVVLLQSIDLTTVAAAIAVITLVIVGIALTMKGPDVSKRVIRKV
jgi:type IV secretory pathway VirB2 component (pilin)